MTAGSSGASSVEAAGERIVSNPDAPASLRALGKDDLPETIELAAGTFRHVRTLQHSFFAATGLYADERGEQRLFKAARQAPLFGLPTRFLGRILTRRELALYEACRGIDGTPDAFEAVGDAALARPFIAGHPLARGERVDDEFFPRLQALLAELHARDVAFVDLQKCDNVLVGDDGRPHLFDFQASWRLAPRSERGWLRLVPERLLRYVLEHLQESDRFHVRKHWRRCRPDTIPADELASTSRPSLWIRAHRVVHNRWRALRRRLRGDGPEDR